VSAWPDGTPPQESGRPAVVELELVEPREGMAVVHGPDGAYLGCIGVERWRELVEVERRQAQARGLEERIAEALERVAVALESEYRDRRARG
jgi:hypothetical protein